MAVGCTQLTGLRHRLRGSGRVGPGSADGVFTRDAAPGLHRVSEDYVNWFLLEEGGRVTIVDAGLPAHWGALHAALDAIGRRPSDVEALVLTHAHYDHVGFAERARTELKIPVYVHADDEPLTKHPLRFKFERFPGLYLRYPGFWPVLAAFTKARAPLTQAISEVTTFTDGETLPVPGSPKVVFTPGHTYGHCSLHLPESDALIAGDAVVTMNPYTGGTGPQMVAKAAQADSAMCERSLDRVAATGATTVLCGHGEVWRTGAASIAEAARGARARLSRALPALRRP